MDGVEIRVILDFGAGFIDHRGWFMNAGRVSMADLAQLTAWRDALMAARYRGVRTVEYDGKRVTYASDGEMAAALADLNRQIAGATDRISVVRIQSSKGL